MRKQMRPVIIKRESKEEIDKAIKDLVENRGFKLLFGPVSESLEGKTYVRDYQYNRRIFQQNIHATMWRAKLQKIDEEEVN